MIHVEHAHISFDSLSLVDGLLTLTRSLDAQQQNAFKNWSKKSVFIGFELCLPDVFVICDHPSRFSIAPFFWPEFPYPRVRKWPKSTPKPRFQIVGVAFCCENRPKSARLLFAAPFLQVIAMESFDYFAVMVSALPVRWCGTKSRPGNVWRSADFRHFVGYKPDGNNPWKVSRFCTASLLEPCLSDTRQTSDSSEISRISEYVYLRLSSFYSNNFVIFLFLYFWINLK